MSFNYYYIRTDDFPAHTGGGQGLVITRDNYEAYFVMYVDDELNGAQRKAVEQFIAANPDLEEEMVMLQQSVLRPNDHIVFEPKEILFKGTAARSPINDQNCEEYFVLYGDDELTNAEKESVEQFVYHHPQYQAEFELIQQVKLMPDNSLSFPGKTNLYRTEEDDNRVIAFPWWRLSAAAIALLVIGSLALYMANNIKTGQPEFAGNTNSPGSVTGNTKEPQVATPGYVDAEPVTTGKGIDNIATPALAKTTTTSEQPAENIVVSNSKKNIVENSNKQEPSYVQQVSMPTPVQHSEKNDIAFQPKLIEVTVDNTHEEPAVKTSIIKQTIAEPLAVHTVAVKTEDEPDLSSHYVLNAPINKTPLRGFFRKVSRVVDKVTNPEENGKKGIRIANLEIALN
ncbi:hypothetical protein [Niastella populi]|uniref:Uncharacterized protein n=1 Tax=Niastella populi TaxID=550983 RepID=A0A1V9GBR6_9BACT|nr:hypothetical protein [Niastella populi]OQP67908.1 hypothetical protein A4R26_10430 [Niastella populi]